MTEDARAGQEAARLLAAAQDWLRTSAPHLAPVGEDGETCSCPLCRVVASVREADPEVVGGWVDAALAAATSALAPTAATAPDDLDLDVDVDGHDSDAGDDVETPTSGRFGDAQVPGADAPRPHVAPAEAGDGSSTAAPDAGATGQDDERGRRVRSIPVDREPGEPAR